MLFNYVPYSVVVIAQVLCAIHAVRNDRQNWLWIIIMAPGIGCLVYLATQVRPNARSRRAATGVASGVVTAIAPTWRLKQLREAVEHCDTVENRLALATECITLGRHEEAVTLFEGCRTGVFKDDPVVLQGLARSYYERGDHEKARATLDELFDVAPRERTVDNLVLHGRALEALGDTDAALGAYAAAASKGIGDEARCRRAVLLDKLGRKDEARTIFEKIDKDARRSSRHYRYDQRAWIATAREHLAKR